MPKNTVNWESAETWQRLVASIYATGIKIDLKATAQVFGTTYDTLENRLRKIKKDAEALKAEAEARGPNPAVMGSRAKSGPSTPRKSTPKKSALETVATGRVSKQTPSKKKVIKEESPAAERANSSSDNTAVNTPLYNNDLDFGGDNIDFDFGGHMSFDHFTGPGDGGFY